MRRCMLACVCLCGFVGMMSVLVAGVGVDGCDAVETSLLMLLTCKILFQLNDLKFRKNCEFTLLIR